MSVDTLLAFLIGFFLGSLTGFFLTALIVAKNIGGRDDFDEDEF